MTIPIAGIPLFVEGPQGAGWEAVDLVCTQQVAGKTEPFPPHKVILDDGEQVDIGHVYAGLRADFNREGSFSMWRDLMLGVNTTYGDYGQVAFEGVIPLLAYDKFPKDQPRGNVIGLWPNKFYRIPANAGVSLSEAFDLALREAEASMLGVLGLTPPEP